MVNCLTGSKSEKKKKSGTSTVHWSEGGQVQLLSFAEKAGVEENNQREVEQSKETSVETEETVAGADQKEDDKRVVTVSTFGFPEVCIQPSPEEEAAKEKEEEEKQKTEGKVVKEKEGKLVGEKDSSKQATEVVNVGR